MGNIASTSFLSEEHTLFRQQTRRFVQSNLAPHVDQWERDKSFPREVYTQMGEAGLLGVGFDEALGGSGGDIFHDLILAEELVRSGSPGLAASLGSLCIAIPPIIHAGSAEQKARWLPKIFSGEWIAALAVTEPDAGSDVANIRTKAVRDGDDYIVNGAKTFITSGTRADYLTVVVRTGQEGAGGVSLLGIETDNPGFRVSRNMPKMGWHASDTAELVFEDMRVPVANLIGPENGGFVVLMQNFAMERLMLAVSSVEMAQMALDASIAYARERKAFGRPIGKFQVNRHKMAEMLTGIEVTRTFVYALAQRVIAGDTLIQEVAMAKNAATDMASKVIDHAVQLHGGYGFMQEFLVERLYRDMRLYPIGGGTREIMNEVISKSMGF